MPALARSIQHPVPFRPAPRLRATLLLLGVLSLCPVAVSQSWEMGEAIKDIEGRLSQAFTKNPGYGAGSEYARYLIYQDRPEDAVLVLRGITGADPAGLRLLWGEAAFFTGDTEKSRAELESITSGDAEFWPSAQELLISLHFLEGRIEDCEAVCSALLEKDPRNRPARLFHARVLQRHGRHDEALQTLQAGLVAHPSSLDLLEARASILDDQSRTTESLALRRSTIPLVNAAPPRHAEGMTAAASAMRHLGEPYAASQCLQLALRYWPADPFVQLEKIRLQRDAYGFSDALSRSLALQKRYPRCGLAAAELAETLWAMRKSATQVSSLCRQALELDPTLLAARNRLIFHDLVLENRASAESLLQRNREINPNDPQTARLASFLSHLRNGTLGADSDPSDLQDMSFADLVLLGQILCAREDYASATAWLDRAVRRAPENALALREAGHAWFRRGYFSRSRDLLEQAFAKNRYDVQTKNVLDLIDKIQSRKTLRYSAPGGLELTIGFPDKGEALAEYSAFLASNDLLEIRDLTGLTTDGRLEIHLCDSMGDLAVASEGMASFGCGSCSAGALGVVNFDSLILIWTPRAAGGMDRAYRFDEALFRGLAHHVLRKSGPSGLPLWLREGITQYAASQANPEFAPAGIDDVVSFLRAAPDFTFATLNEEFIGEAHPLCRVYGWLLVNEWGAMTEGDFLAKCLSTIQSGRPWDGAVRSLAGLRAGELESHTREKILARFHHLRLPPMIRTAPETLMEKAKYSEADKIVLADYSIRRKRHAEAGRILDELARSGCREARMYFLAGRLAGETGNPGEAVRQIGLGFEIEKLAGESAACAGDFEALGNALLELGKQPQAIQALLQAARLNPYDLRQHGPIAKLGELLKDDRSTSDTWFQTLETTLPGQRNDVEIRLELAQWHLRNSRPQKALRLLQSAAGVQPAAPAIHRELADLAGKLDVPRQAYASSKVLHALRPRDRRVIENLIRYADALGRTEEADGWRRKLADATPRRTDAP